jgi:hypothetical protein
MVVADVLQSRRNGFNEVSLANGGHGHGHGPENGKLKKGLLGHGPGFGRLSSKAKGVRVALVRGSSHTVAGWGLNAVL